MRRIHYAILIGQLLSFALIITFTFADATFGFVENLVGEEPSTAFNRHTISACLVGVVGAVSIWISYFYIRKSQTMRDWIVLCAWTQRVKSGNQWITITEFLSEHLGYNVSHGMSEEVVEEMRTVIDSNWRKLAPAREQPESDEPTANEPAPKPTPGMPLQKRPPRRPPVFPSSG